MPETDPKRVPVIAAVGQTIEREQTVDAVELAERAARAALAQAPALAARIERLSVIAVSFSPVGRAPASTLARRLGLSPARCEVTRAGGNMPQWAVNRAAHEISQGRLETTLIAGAEATRSMRAADPEANFLDARRSDEDGERDETVGPSLSGMMGPAETAAGLRAPAEIYPILESALAQREGRSFERQREHLSGLMARFTEVAEDNPYAWFRQPRTAEEIAEVTPENRLTAEPYTKRMNSFPNVDQGSAILVTTLARARELGVADGCVFVWSGATNTELAPAARAELGGSPALRAASRAAREAAGVDTGELAFLECYSCFPIAVEAAAEAHGLELDDPRGLTLTGGMPFFGGPGNNYSSHGIAALVERLRESGGVGLVNANGGYLSKHSVGLYGDRPPVNGFRLADTREPQERIEAAARPVALAAEGEATVAGGTVVYGRDGSVARAPVIADLDDGRRVVAQADPALLPDLAGVSLVGRRVRVAGEPPAYRL